MLARTPKARKIGEMPFEINPKIVEKYNKGLKEIERTPRKTIIGARIIQKGK